MADVPYQSLYRRYRPQRFDEVRGQEHITRALRNAVREDRVSHGYLFSGPRGTGKTSSARILAKALNCAAPVDGEPCGVCDSCVAIQQGVSFDTHELDAASNNGVEAMRDLISRAALGTPGRWKVYIVDEVHMLSVAASNTLLKTLEEPPAHVVFVLATTEPQKVLPTIRSRVQHYQFGLLPVEDLSGLVAAVNRDAGLGLSDADLERVVRRGAGSARDSLSALDQAAAFGGMDAETPVADEVIEAMAERDAARALAAVAEGVAAGRDPRRLGEEILEQLRDGFLATRAATLVQRPREEVERVAAQAGRLGAAALVRAMEVIGDALREMKDAIDPRISLEVALVRVTAPDADASPAALLERIERLERRLGSGDAAGAEPAAAERAPAPGGSAAAPAEQPAPPRPRSGAPSGLAAAREAARAGGAGSRAAPPIPPRPGRGARSAATEPGASAPGAAAQDPPLPEETGAGAPAPATLPPARSETGPDGSSLPDRDSITKAWGDAILPNLRPRAKALFGAGRFVDVSDGSAVFALPNEAHKRNCEPTKGDVESALEAHFRTRIPLRLVTEVDLPAGGPPPVVSGDDRPPPPPDDVPPEELADLEDAPPGLTSPAERLKQAFPGSEEIE